MSLSKHIHAGWSGQQLTKLFLLLGREAASSTAPKDPHPLAFMPLWDPLPLSGGGMDPVTCFWLATQKWRNGRPVLRSGYKDCVCPLAHKLTCPLWRSPLTRELTYREARGAKNEGGLPPKQRRTEALSPTSARSWVLPTTLILSASGSCPSWTLDVSSLQDTTGRRTQRSCTQILGPETPWDSTFYCLKALSVG